MAYTIEASLRSLHGHLDLLLATQIIVLGRYPLGGGSAEAASNAFGTGWAFVPIGALIVDFVLTIAISVAAGGSALIADFPSLAPARIGLGMALLLGVCDADVVWPRRKADLRCDHGGGRRVMPASLPALPRPDVDHPLMSVRMSSARSGPIIHSREPSGRSP
jgi:hypothetical protein